MPRTKPSSDVDLDLRARIRELVDEHTQAKVVRETGVAQSSLSSYLTRTRVPASFCHSLIKNLNVNPSWLLLGEGKKYTSEVSESKANTATDLIELVEAMETVTRMRLGALAGKGYQKVLRHLDESLHQHERLRESLNQHSKPVLEKLIADLRRACEQKNLTQLRFLLRVARQVSRLCDDAGVEKRFLEVQSRSELALGNDKEALHYAYQAYTRTIPESVHATEDFFASTHALVVSLTNMNHLEEAHRICRSARALASGEARECHAYQELANLEGLLGMHLGDIQTALHLIDAGSFRSMGGPSRSAEMLAMNALFLSGVLGFHAVQSNWEESFHKSTMLMTIADWSEDPKLLQDAKKRCVGAKEHQLGPTHIRSVWNQALLDAQSFRGLAVLRNLEGRAEDALKEQIQDTTYREFYLCSYMSRISRMAGQKTVAREYWRRAEKALSTMSEKTSIHLLDLAQHYRNSLRILGTRSRSKEAVGVKDKIEEWFIRHQKAGYALFRGLV